MLKHRIYRRTRPFSFSILQSAIETAERSVGKTELFGGRVWLVPLWYHNARIGDKKNKLAIAEVTKRAVKRPRMYEASRILGPFEAVSSIPWVVGKGFIGRLSRTDSPDYEILQHSTFWPTNLEQMTEEEWENSDPDVRGDRLLLEAKKLKAMYGTAIGASVRIANSACSIGCITLHTPSSRSLEPEQSEVVANLLVVQAHRLAEALVNEGPIRG